MLFTGISESDNVKDTPLKRAGQAGPVENLRGEHYYARVPDCLWRLSSSERVAAVEVWTALHHYLRVSAALERVTDDLLRRCPSIADRSVEHIGKGLAILSRLGLLERVARGSRREVAIVARLKGPKRQVSPARGPENKAEISRANHSPDVGKMVPPSEWRKTFDLMVSENRQTGS